MSGCELCGKQASFTCSKCGTTYYCCKDHQRQDWQKHKLICQDKKSFPKHLLDKPCKPDAGQQCYVTFIGSVINDRKGKVAPVNKSIPISPQQLVRFTESPSHMVSFLNQLTSPTGAFISELNQLAVANKFKCSHPSCNNPAKGVIATSGCFIFSPPVGREGVYNYNIGLVRNATYCTRTECKVAAYVSVQEQSKLLVGELSQGIQRAIIAKANKKNNGNGKQPK